MKNIAKNSIIILVLAAGLFSCKKTWLMYDTTQSDRLYFPRGQYDTMSVLTRTRTFAYTSDETIFYPVDINLMGMPAGERGFEIEILEDTLTSWVSGGERLPVRNGVKGVDYEIGTLTLPAGAVTTTVPITINRKDDMKTSHVSVLFRIKPAGGFIPQNDDYFRVLVSDGDLPWPSWWNNKVTGVEWQMYVGKFTSDKLKRFFDLYHDMENTNPEMYRELEDRYGRYLEMEYNPETGL